MFRLNQNENFILLFVALFPVFLDTVFKYWIFRYLNKMGSFKQTEESSFNAQRLNNSAPIDETELHQTTLKEAATPNPCFVVYASPGESGTTQRCQCQNNCEKLQEMCYIGLHESLSMLQSAKLKACHMAACNSLCIQGISNLLRNVIERQLQFPPLRRSTRCRVDSF